MSRPGFDIRAACADPVATRPTEGLERLAEPPPPLQLVPPTPAEAAEPARAAPARKARKPAAGPRGSARPGARGVTVWLEPETWLTLKMIGLQTGRTTQDVVDGLIEKECAKHRGAGGSRSPGL